MKCLEQIDALIKALESLRAQIVLDVSGVMRSVELVNEVKSPHLALPIEEVE